MATYDVEIPGKGTFRVESAGELTEAQAYRAAAGQADMAAKADPTAGMSTTEKVRAGAGKALSDLFLGARQFAETQNFLPGPSVSQIRNLLGQESPVPKLEAQAAESRKLDAALMSTGEGKAGNIGGNIAVAVPTFFIPGANTYTGAAAIGGLMGGLQPTVAGESREVNALTGAGLGVLGQATGNLIGRVLRPVQSEVSPQAANLVKEAQARGISLQASQVTGSRPLAITESVMENLPLTAGPQLAIKQGQKEAFNRAVSKTFGENVDAITPEVAGAARTRIGATFTDLAKRNTLNVSDDLMTRLGEIESNAAKFETGEVGRIVTNRIDDLLAKVDASGNVPGVAYRKFDSALGRTMRSTTNGDLRHALGELRGAVRDAMDKSISTADQAAWQEARRQYGNLMTVAPLAAKSETGDVSGRTLLAAANAANQNAKFGAQSELATLGRIGRAFVADQIPNSGTAQRLAIQGLLTGGGSGLGAITALASGGDPLKGAATGAAVTAGGLMSPRLIQSAINSPAGQAYLTRGLIALTPAERAAINAITRSGSMGLIGYAGQ